MEVLKRKSFEGVWNIVRFNWHFYIIILSVIACILFFLPLLLPPAWLIYLATGLMLIPVVLSLCVSWYIYDLSGLYTLNWLDTFLITKPATIYNIHAGFDETSYRLAEKFPDTKFFIFDFYNPAKHTELSIKRARKTRAAYPGTISIDTGNPEWPVNQAELILLIFAAHEIRNHSERIRFFHLLKPALSPEGRIIVTEHLRDLPNFLAYTIGFLHFYSNHSWKKTFHAAGLRVVQQKNINPFVITYLLENHGTSS